MAEFRKAIKRFEFNYWPFVLLLSTNLELEIIIIANILIQDDFLLSALDHFIFRIKFL